MDVEREEPYRVALAEGKRFGEWRALGATRKGANVVALAQHLPRPPARLVEIGCGDGALLSELTGRGFASTRVGFDISPAAVELARQRPGVASTAVFDGRRTPAGDDSYDLAILSHVLEHVTDPAALLAEAARLAPAVILEVPLEDNRSARRFSRDDLHAATGHIQRFDQAAVAGLVDNAGLVLQRDLIDPLTRDFHLFFAETPRDRAAGHAKALVRSALHRASPRLAARAFTVHYAALCTRR